MVLPPDLYWCIDSFYCFKIVFFFEQSYNNPALSDNPIEKAGLFISKCYLLIASEPTIVFAFLKGNVMGQIKYN